MDEPEKKWVHWCEACKAWVAHVNAHGVSENEALLAHIATLDTALAASRAQHSECLDTLQATAKNAIAAEEKLRDAERALRDAPDMTCESPEARAWREKYGLTPPPVAPSGGAA